MFGVVRRCSSRVPIWLSASPSHHKTVLRYATPPFSPVNGKLLPATTRNFHLIAKWRQQAATAARSYEDEESEALGNPSAPVQSRAKAQLYKFADLRTQGLVDPTVIDNITDRMGLDMMTEVQIATINEALNGTDIIARAKTGTGKTIAFLLPILQKIIEEDPSLAGRVERKRKTTSEDVRAIVISPTRELAEQIAHEAKRLTENTKIICQCAVGGTQKREMLMRTRREGCHVLIATPGRLKDILSDEYSGVKAPYLDMLVLDEADRLLDDGFWPEVDTIISEYLPSVKKKNRQTLMFSATVPKEVTHIVRKTLKPGYQFVDCVGQNDVPTHEKVKQKVVQAHNFENQLPALFELCQREIERANKGEAKPFKAVVFFNSTAHTTVASSVFRNVRSSDPRHPLHPARIIEIHSKLSQAQRTRAADTFRRAKSAILFSSDVTARGMDFPDVTHVVQIGLPTQRETYIHRLGRTARAGKEGEGWLILSTIEAQEAGRRLNNLPIEPDHSLQTAKVDMSQPAQLPAGTAQILKDLGEAHKSVDVEDLAKAYKAFIGIYSWVGQKQMLIDQMNRMTRFGWAMSSPPRISRALIQRLGLSRVSGLNIADGGNRSPRASFGGRNLDDDDEFDAIGREGRDMAGRRGSFGDRTKSFGDDRRSYGNGSSPHGGRRGYFGYNADSDGPRRSSYGDGSKSFGDRRGSYGDGSKSFGDRRGSYDYSSSSFGDRRNSSGPRRGS